MFSESEGYSAAIPSKRDLQTLVKTIQDEISCVVIERYVIQSNRNNLVCSDRGLVKIIGRFENRKDDVLLRELQGSCQDDSIIFNES